MNAPISRFGDIEDLWMAEDALTRLLEYQCGKDARLSRLFSWIGKTDRILPAEQRAVQLLADRIADSTERIRELLQPVTLDDTGRLERDLCIVAKGYDTYPPHIFELQRNRGLEVWLLQDIQNRRYPVAVWRAAVRLGLRSETAVRAVAVLKKHGGRTSITNVLDCCLEPARKIVMETTETELSGYVAIDGNDVVMTSDVGLASGNVTIEAGALERFIQFLLRRFPVYFGEQRIGDDAIRAADDAKLEGWAMSDFAYMCGKEPDLAPADVFYDYMTGHSAAILDAGKRAYSRYLSRRE